MCRCHCSRSSPGSPKRKRTRLRRRRSTQGMVGEWACGSTGTRTTAWRGGWRTSPRRSWTWTRGAAPGRPGARTLNRCWTGPGTAGGLQGRAPERAARGSGCTNSPWETLVSSRSWCSGRTWCSPSRTPWWTSWERAAYSAPGRRVTTTSSLPPLSSTPHGTRRTERRCRSRSGVTAPECRSRSTMTTGAARSR